MEKNFYWELAQKSVAGMEISDTLAAQILEDASIAILPLLDAAYQVRKTYFGNEVRLHILNNAQNGHCQEDCHYCAQAKSSQAEIEAYGIKPDEEIVQEARLAYAKGAFCYCMVFAGRQASPNRIDRLKRLIARIKTEFPDKEVCVSTGFVSAQGAVTLKEAGLDRLNHNLNTSEPYYPNICTTHTFADRMNTLLAARRAGIKLCSGMIVGMGEAHADIIAVAKRLRALKAESIPINWLVSIEGNRLKAGSELNPLFCLRVLCLFRFLNPQSEIRIAAGREMHLRSLQVMALYPANSLFLQGYLNAKGEENAQTLQMIKDAGFCVVSPDGLEGVANEAGSVPAKGGSPTVLKDWQDLHPALK